MSIPNFINSVNPFSCEMRPNVKQLWRRKVGSGWVGDAHAQKIMGNGVISPPHDFKLPTRWCCRVDEGINYGIGVVIYGTTSIPNFMNFRPAIF
jgi:hypothetical protein